MKDQNQLRYERRINREINRMILFGDDIEYAAKILLELKFAKWN